MPQAIEDGFEQILATATAIEDATEQEFFVIVHIPYLQPFDDVNKRVSRLAANIPLIRGNLSPLSFADVPRQTYTEAVLGVYELNKIDLLKDVFIWAYERSAARYAAVRQSLGEPDPFRLRYREQLREIIGDLIRSRLGRKAAAARIGDWVTKEIDPGDRQRFAEIVEAELTSLHEGNFARYRIRDAKRALDYLVSRPEVDADRIGATGCSGGGTVTTYISALDPRVKVAAPACYINTFREVFPGPTGDAEQSVPGFLEAGLDIADYIELFAPKPWLIGSTREDFFPVAGAQQAFEEAQRWYGWFGADDRIKWAVGPGGHGTPVEVREAIYGWMQRWLGNPSADAHDVPVNLLPDWQLWATESGQVDGRQLYEYLRDEYKRLHRPLGREALAAEIRRIATGPIAAGTDFVPVPKFDFSAGGDQILIRAGDRVLLFKSVVPRAFTGNWILALRALLIGETLPGIRIRSIRAAIDSLGADKVEIAARGMPAVWARWPALPRLRPALGSGGPSGLPGGPERSG